MDVLTAIRERRSCRAFLGTPLPREKVETVLELAVNAPSANNLQPWEFIVVADRERERLSRTLLKAYREKHTSCSSGAVKPLPEAIRRRGATTLEAMQAYTDRLSIPLDDFVNEGSCRFYGAPVAIIICLDDCFPSWRMIDVGVAVGYLALAAHACGLATCPIGFVTYHIEEIKDLLNIPDNKRVAIGVALGYPDRGNPMSQFRSARADISELVSWV